MFIYINRHIRNSELSVLLLTLTVPFGNNVGYYANLKISENHKNKLKIQEL